MSSDVQSPSAGQLVRQEFGASEVSLRAEMATAAVAAQAKAMVEARYILALRNPRSMDQVRVDLLKECRRPGFAEAARFVLPIGKDSKKFPKGYTIRFAESVMRALKNILADSMIVYEDDAKRIVQVSVTDLESNITYPTQIIIQKTVERSWVKDDQEPISVRTNSAGKPVYLIAATENEIQMKQNALVSKAIRTSVLRLVPGDILEECLAQIEKTKKDATAADPAAAKKAVIDGFAALEITPTDLASYLGHSLDRVTPKELDDLRGIYRSVRDGETTWEEVMEAAGTPDPDLQEEIRARKVREAEEHLRANREQQQQSAADAGEQKPAEPPKQRNTGSTNPFGGLGK